MGTLSLNDGSTYFGEFECDAKHGLGELCLPDGRYFIGYWENDKIRDKSFLKHPNGG